MQGEDVTINHQDVWCVVPVYNNAGTVRQVVSEALRHLDHVLVVDDGSRDANVRELLRDLPVEVVCHEQNRGKGRALRTALEHIHAAAGRFMITLDADGQHYPEDIPRLLEALDADTVVIGARDEVVGDMPAKSRFGRRFSDFWVWIETGWPVRDTQSGFRAYPVEHLVELSLRCDHYDFEIEVLCRAAWAGLRFVNVSIKVHYPDRAERVTSFRPFMDNLRFSLTHIRLIGRRLMPWPSRRLVPRELSPGELFRHPSRVLRRLLRENASPRGLAVSAWFGVFLGTLPLIGIHMLTILYVSMRLRLNKMMSLSIQNVCMPPVVPGICIAFGYFMLRGEVITQATARELWSDPVARALEWAVGSLVVAPVLATIFALLVYFSARHLQTRRVERSCNAGHSRS